MWLITATALASTLFPCDNPGTLAPLAADGALPNYQRACLEKVAQMKGPHRQAASEMVLADATARGDRVDWARAAARHLDEIDGSDGHLNVAYVRHLFTSHRTEEVIAFSERALRHAADWTDPQLALSVHRLRSSAALSRWTETTIGQARVHAFARDWIAASQAVGAVDAMADQLCRSTGPPEDCRVAPTVASADSGIATE